MLTEREVSAALGGLVASTPGWSDLTVEQYTVELRMLADPAALGAACRWVSRSWEEPRRPPLAVILSAYDRERAYRTDEIEPARIHCDGTGWRTADIGTMTPCPRCNPALAAVFEDEHKLRLWLDGATLESLAVGVERVSGRLRYTDGTRAPSCSGWDEPAPSFKLGLQAAWAEYAAECATAGRVPAEKLFTRLREELPDDRTTVSPGSPRPRTTRETIPETSP